MALFPQDDVLPEEESARRHSVTREAGTRRLVIGFVLLVALWFVGSRIWDVYLLRQKWPPLTAEPAGLTVVSTLDLRGSYDRNIFQVLQIEGSARAALTNYGWEAIFSGQHGALATDRVGGIIKSAIDQDSQTGYAMLTPFLAAEVRALTGDRRAFAGLLDSYVVNTALPMTDEEKTHRRIAPRNKTLRELLDYFEQSGRSRTQGETGAAEGGSGSQHQVEHGLAIPGEVLIQTCPVVLCTRHFSGGSVEEHESVMSGKTYSVWLTLTPEGRSRFYQWSRSHANEHLLLVLGGEVVANGRIAMTMDVSQWEITNLKDVVAANKLVGYINSHQVAAK